MSKAPKKPLFRAKTILDGGDDIHELRQFVDDTKRKLITLGFIPPPVWRGTSSAYIKNFGQLVE